MPDERFRIEWDEAAGLLRIIVSGFWDLVTVEEFKGAFAVAEQDSRRVPGSSIGLRVLIDARAMRAQGQDVTSALQAAFVRERAIPTRSAMIVESALFRLQLQRVTQGERRFFENEGAALSWLQS